jgi:hypothetical protein
MPAQTRNTMILPEVTANPWVYVHGVWGAMLPMFAMFLNEWDTAWGTYFHRWPHAAAWVDTGD